MPDPATIPLARRPELLITLQEESGRHVIKDTTTGDCYTLGEQESFLLLRLDSQQTADAIRAAYEERFGEALSPEDLQEFLLLAQSQGLLRPAHEPGTALGNAPAKPADPVTRNAGQPPPPQAAAETRAPPQPRSGQSILHWRQRLFDPDRLFTRLAPKLWFVWTYTFLALSLGCIVTAAALVGINWHEVVRSFAHALRWETLVLVWLALLLTTLCHEFARGLTCKHYGGKVHEFGVVAVFLMPCFYCDTSDTRLFCEKSKRLWVTFAGGYCDLCVWALTVFAWRLTEQDGIVNYVAWVVLAVLGMRIVFNFNPLIKLDGYYLFSDLVEIPDLQQRAAAYMKAHLARLFWGGRRLAREEKGSVLITYGVASWLFGVTFLALLVAAVVQFLGESWSLIGIITALFLGVMVLQGPLHGLLGEKISQMIFQRHKRALLLATGAVLGLAILVFGRMDDRASGTFRVRPVVRAELRAPVAGFLREFVFDEGSRVPPGVVVLRLEVPNLANHRAEKQAEVREAEARVRLLEAGPGFAAVAEQRRRVEQAREWRDLAKRDLARVEQALAAEMVWLEQEVVRQHLELDYSAEALMRYQQLLPQRAISKDEYQRAEKRVLVHEVQLGQANALQRARKALGAREAEAELTWRERGLADAQGSLTLLEAGTQPTEIDTERSRLARAKEELNYVEARQKKTLVYSPVGGLMTTPHLAEKVGQYFREGELICTIDDPDVVDVEITLPDQESARVQPGQAVELKVLVRPAETFRGEVDRIVTRDGSADAHHSMTVYCRPDNPLPDLRPGTIGEARVTYGSGAIGKVLVDRVQRWLRTDFW